MADYQGKLRGAQIDALPEEIEKKQDKLHVTLLNNGNVRIDFGNASQDFMPATPSGDPMHYAYEAVGAVWNGSTGFWEYRAADGGLTDLTNADMRVCYSEAWLQSAPVDGLFFNVKGRTTIAKLVATSATNVTNSYRGDKMEVAFVSASKNAEILPKTLVGTFWFCYKLTAIIGIMNVRYITNPTEVLEFRADSMLETVNILNLKNNLSFADSPKISKETVLYAITNAAPTSQIVITLSGKVYGSMIRDPEIIAALATQPLITLASA
jgi:hypothetical protein